MTNRPEPLVEDKGLPGIRQTREMPPVKPPKKDQRENIKGYRDLAQEEIDLINEGKVLAEKCGEFVKKLESMGFTANDFLSHDHISR